jgi:flavin reductase (DIM6/NTAB) family NADH-FMN oxidoreductase RutF
MHELLTDIHIAKALPPDRAAFQYAWPYPGAVDPRQWRRSATSSRVIRSMPEEREEIAADSRWPAFFPSPICITTAAAGGGIFVEKVVGASIVNRFPYVMMLSFCREPLSDRHHTRRTFMNAVEASGRVAVQFLMPSQPLQALLLAITEVSEHESAARFRRAGLPLRPTQDGAPPIFQHSYLVYEGRLVAPSRDFDGNAIYDSPWRDIGSHRAYFFEIEAISLRNDIASGLRPLHWRSLPTWSNGESLRTEDLGFASKRQAMLARSGFVKSYQSDYVFPGPGTVAFEADDVRDDHAVKHLPPLAADQIEVDNNRARWPCFFPSSVGLITVADRSGAIGAMSCGSTTIVSRSPLTVAICVSYARINERYAPRASLDHLMKAERFGCGVPYYAPHVLDAISYLGNVSRRLDPDKSLHCGLTPATLGRTIGFLELPIHYGCTIVDAVPLGTHHMFLGRVDEISIRSDLTEQNPLQWCPWAGSAAP